MPFAIGNLIVSTFSRQVYVVIGTYTVPGLVSAFRGLSLGMPSTQVFVQNADVDTNFTWFVIGAVVPPPGLPPPGTRVQIHASPLALFSGSTVVTFPITEKSASGILWSYAEIPTFPGPVYGLVVEPDGNQVLAQVDEITAIDGAS